MGQKATGIHCLLWKYEKFLDVQGGMRLADARTLKKWAVGLLASKK